MVEVQLGAAEHPELTGDDLSPREVDEPLAVAAVDVGAGDPVLLHGDVELEDRLSRVGPDQPLDLATSLDADVDVLVGAAVGGRRPTRRSREVGADDPNPGEHPTKGRPLHPPTTARGEPLTTGPGWPAAGGRNTDRLSRRSSESLALRACSPQPRRLPA